MTYYNQNNTNILSLFYENNTRTSNTNIPASVTNYRINNIDISNNYVGLGTNSKISASSKHTISYFYDSSSIGNFFELNLPIFSSSAVINTDFRILPTSNHNGLLIQFLKSTTISFNPIYKIDMSFVIVGGGGGGGGCTQSNAGGGGGAGELIIGTINDFSGTAGRYLDIVIGSGGDGKASSDNTTDNGVSGSNTFIYYKSSTNTIIDTIKANGGTGGGNGKGSSNATSGGSTGGAGSYSSGVPTVGDAVQRPTQTAILGGDGGNLNDGIFINMTSYNNKGGTGQDDNNNDNGAGGGGGGAGSVGVSGSASTNPSNGGDGKTVTFGSTNFSLAGGGGGGRGKNVITPSYGSAGGGNGGFTNANNGSYADANTGSGGGGAYNERGNGGNGGSGTVILYIIATGISII